MCVCVCFFLEEVYTVYVYVGRFHRESLFAFYDDAPIRNYKEGMRKGKKKENRTRLI